MTAIIDMQKQEARQRLEWCLRDVPALVGRRINISHVIYGISPALEPTEQDRQMENWIHRHNPHWLIAQAWHDRMAMARVA